MARRAKRLTRHADFIKTKAARQRQSSSYMHVNTHFANHDESRLGLSVGKRLTGTSVQRNLVRRCLAEQFRLHADALPNIDLVVTLRKPCTDRKQARQAACELKDILLKLAADK